MMSSTKTECSVLSIIPNIWALGQLQLKSQAAAQNEVAEQIHGSLLIWVHIMWLWSTQYTAATSQSLQTNPAGPPTMFT